MYFVEICFFNSKHADFNLSQIVGEVANLVEFMEASTVLLCKHKLNEAETTFTVK